MMIPEFFREQYVPRRHVRGYDLHLNGILPEVLVIGAVYRDKVFESNPNSETVRHGPLRQRIGGSAGISAVALKRLGLEPLLMAAVGETYRSDGEAMRQFNTQYVFSFDTRKSTPESTHLIEEGCKRSGSNTGSEEVASLTEKDLEGALNLINMYGLRGVLLTSFTSMPDLVGRPVGEFFQELRKRDVTTGVDLPMPSERWTPEMQAAVQEEIIPHTDIACMNCKELYFLTREQKDPDFQLDEMRAVETYMTRPVVESHAQRLIDRGARIVNIHYGERGTILVTRKQTMLAGTRRVNGDPVGAGNVQNSALFAALIRGVRADRTTERVLFHMGMAANAAAYVRIQKGDYFPTVDDIVQTLRNTLRVPSSGRWFQETVQLPTAATDSPGLSRSASPRVGSNRLPREHQAYTS